MKPQTQTVLKALQSGKSLTEKQARTFGVKSLRARVSELRREGFPVYTNSDAKGTSYRLGTPSRTMVAAAYAMLGNKAFQ